jgi:hypothetical protein
LPGPLAEDADKAMGHIAGRRPRRGHTAEDLETDREVVGRQHPGRVDVVVGVTPADARRVQADHLAE